MKKALVVVAAIALVVWVISWFRVPGAVATSAAKPWPGGMGGPDSAAGRATPMQANEASMKLMALANALPKNEGREFVAPPGEGIVLCRCGHSANKPFCDSSHKRIGFVADDSASRVPES